MRYRLRTTHFLLLNTYNLLPAIYYLLPTTYYLLPTTYYSPVTERSELSHISSRALGKPILVIYGEFYFYNGSVNHGLTPQW